MNFLKKFRAPPEWKKFESAGYYLNEADSSYSSLIRITFNNHLINISHSLYPSASDPFLQVQNQFTLLSTRLAEKIGTSIFTNGCYNHLKQIHSEFSTSKEKYQALLSEEKEAQRQVSKTSGFFTKAQNINEFRKANLQSQSAMENERQCRKETNQAQIEFEMKFKDYQKNFVQIIIANLGTYAEAQSRLAKNTVTIGADIKKLSDETMKFPEIKKENVNIEKLRKKIQKNKEALQEDR